MKKNILFILLIFCSQLAFAQKYFLVPEEHTDKWLNGIEWTINEKDGIRLKTLFQGVKSNSIIFRIELTNNTGKDFNIDPDSIYYESKKFDTNEMIYSLNTGHSSHVGSEEIQKKIRKLQIVPIQNAEKLIKNTKFLVGLGIAFDSDNLMINRGYSKIDYYKSSILLKNTIEPNITFSRIIIIDQYDFITELDLVIPIGDTKFVIPYKRKE